jgi:hypothetical protein
MVITVDVDGVIGHGHDHGHDVKRTATTICRVGGGGLCPP